MSDEKTFTLAVPDSDLALLRKKLELARFPDELDDAGWEYGSPLADIRRLVARWQEGFDWRKAEAEINALPQFTRDIDVDGFGTLNIHYVHQKSTAKNAIPLLFLHGWPGSFLEVQKILPLLTDASPDHPSFHVVAPSLPGYGYSEAPRKPGFSGAKFVETVHKLMLALGYDEYVAQGGDWGTLIARKLAAEHGGKSVKAWHTNFPSVARPPSPTRFPRLFLQYLVTPYSAYDKAGFERSQWMRSKGSGYFAEQSTKPQTVGYGLADSPVGLLAWIYEKLVEWTDRYPWDDDEALKWISVYWFSRAGPAASTRIYYETVAAGDLGESTWNAVPCGLSYFPKELIVVPKTWARAVGNVVYESTHESGGHFAAYERPAELAGDLRAMFGKGGPAFGVVPGRAGYDD